MIKENGHSWRAESFSLINQKYIRCDYCQMTYGYYLDIKKASKEQSEREDLKEWLKCEKEKKEK